MTAAMHMTCHTRGGLIGREVISRRSHRELRSSRSLAVRRKVGGQAQIRSCDDQYEHEREQAHGGCPPVTLGLEALVPRSNAHLGSYGNSALRIQLGLLRDGNVPQRSPSGLSRALRLRQNSVRTSNFLENKPHETLPVARYPDGSSGATSACVASNRLADQSYRGRLQPSASQFCRQGFCCRGGPRRRNGTSPRA